MKKDLREYSFPIDLKKLSEKELACLSTQIREFLIEKVSKTGGHLASNLGVVELTLAIHKVFNLPKDKLILDVGHQSYVHKILTGRIDGFDKLRQFNGLSGFPKASESQYDHYDTGHSSTSVSAAFGMAKARDIKGDNNEVIALIGDGALTGGMAYEAMNNIGASKSKVIVILNDNGMSISPNIGGISKHLSNLRTSKGYLNAKKFVKTKVKSIPTIGEGIARSLAGFKNDIKYSILEKGGILFEELGFTYLGPIDGHNLVEMTNVLEKAKSLNEPVLIHVITQKGKGYINAEKLPGKFHGVAPFDADTGEIINKPQNTSYSSILGDFLVNKGKEDERLVAITAAMSDATGLWKFEHVFPNRFFDVGIAEEHAVSFACGLAKEGMKPVVAIYSSFLQRSYDQLIIDACMQNLPVIFAIDRAGVVGADGETHNGVFDISYLSQMPNMTVLSPKDGNEFVEMLNYAYSINAPCAIRYPRGECVYDKNITKTQTFIPKNRRIKSGSHVDIWATGKMINTADAVSKKLESLNIYCGIVEVPIIKPLDLTPLNKNVDLIVTIEDNIKIGGMGQQLNSMINNVSNKSDTYVPVMVFGWGDEFIPQGNFDELAEIQGLSPNKIAERISEYFERKA